MARSRGALGSALGRFVLGTLAACGVDDSAPVLARAPTTDPAPPSFAATTFTWGAPEAASQRATAVVRQADGKLVVAGMALGSFVDESGVYVDVFRLTSDGAIDETFGSAGSGHTLVHTLAASERTCLAVTPNGELYVTGTDARYSPAIVRLDAKGVVDASWGEAGTVSIRGDTARSCRVALQSDGKIVTDCGSTTELRRFDLTGKLDPTFGNAGVAVAPGNLTLTGSFAIDPSDNIVLSAWHLPDSGGAVVRLLPTGIADATFDGDGITDLASLRFASSLALDPSGRIVVAGRSVSGPGALVRVDSNGATDATFNGGLPVATAGVPNQVAIDANGDVVLWISSEWGSSVDVSLLQRFTSSGTPDGSFDGRAGEGAPLPRAELGLITPDGRIVSIGGMRVSLDGSDTRATVTRRIPDGSPDPSFGFFGVTTTDLPANRDVPIQVEPARDGRTMILVDSGRARRLLRITVDGALDETFGTRGVAASEATGSAGSFTVDELGRTILMSAYGDVVVLRRLDERGALDRSFGNDGETKIAGAYRATSSGIALAPDGGVVVTWALDGILSVFRTNADGSIDSSFGTNGMKRVALGIDVGGNAIGFGRPNILPDGGVVVAAAVAGRAMVIRLRADGTFASFGKLGIARGESTVVDTIAAFGQPSGAVVALGIAGENGELSVLERFDANGRIDWTFGDGGRILVPSARTGARSELTVDARGRVYVASVAKNHRDVVMSRYTVDGLPDESWGPGGQRPLSGAALGLEDVTTMRATAEGGLLVGGTRFTQTGGVDVVMTKLSLGGR